jgi:hypothetical protein
MWIVAHLRACFSVLNLGLKFLMITNVPCRTVHHCHFQPVLSDIINIVSSTIIITSLEIYIKIFYYLPPLIQFQAQNLSINICHGQFLPDIPHQYNQVVYRN